MSGIKIRKKNFYVPYTHRRIIENNTPDSFRDETKRISGFTFSTVYVLRNYFVFSLQSIYADLYALSHIREIF